MNWRTAYTHWVDHTLAHHRVRAALWGFIADLWFPR